MKKIIYGSMIASALALGGTAFAQTTGTTYGTTGTSNTTSSSGSNMTSGTSNGSNSNSGMTPVLYNQSGTAQNAGGSALTPGYYYNSSGQQVYYYGNGTYYNPSTGEYGGQAFGTNGYGTAGTASGTNAPGVPNTGAGGNAEATWLALIGSAIAAGAGIFYLRNRAVIS